jgi:hypothetical protein
MSNPTPNLIQFPKASMQGRIPSELEMSREIAKENVSLELLAERLTEAGYEIELDKDDNIISIARTGVNLRLQLYPDLNSIRFRSHLYLNRHLSDDDVKSLLSNLNEMIYLAKFTHHRWDDGDLALVAGYAIYFTFGLNMPNTIFAMRRFVDSQMGVYQDHIKGTAYEYKEEQTPSLIKNDDSQVTESEASAEKENKSR